MRELSLFSGGGGGLLATKHLLGWETVAYVEQRKFAQQVLRARIREGYLDEAEIYSDARQFDGSLYKGSVDVVTAGFPCQPFSVAGKRLAGDDERNMWPDTARIVREVRPSFVFLENVPGLLASEKLRVAVSRVERSLFDRVRVREERTIEFPSYFGRVLGDLADLGFDAEWGVLGAGDVGAPHRRKRLWILAALPDAVCGSVRIESEWSLASRREDSARVGREGQAERGQAEPRSDGSARDVADADGGVHEVERVTQPEGIEGERWGEPDGCGALRWVNDSARSGEGWWSEDPAEGKAVSVLGRMADGMAHWMDGIARDPSPCVPRVVQSVRDRRKRLMTTGLGQVPLTAAVAFLELKARLGKV